jgi:hypothetical protein
MKPPHRRGDGAVIHPRKHFQEIGVEAVRFFQRRENLFRDRLYTFAALPFNFPLSASPEAPR